MSPVVASGAYRCFESPAVHPLCLLLLYVSLPNLILCIPSPTLQYCMVNDSRMTKLNSCAQRGVSNSGCLMGLLIYPSEVAPAFDGSM